MLYVKTINYIGDGHVEIGVKTRNKKKKAVLTVKVNKIWE